MKDLTPFTLTPFTCVYLLEASNGLVQTFPSSFSLLYPLTDICVDYELKRVTDQYLDQANKDVLLLEQQDA